MIPNNEQGTIVLFSKLALEMGYTFKEIGTCCPDAILEKDGKIVRVEFEHRAKNFRTHKHNPDDVDLIICWEDNWPNPPLPVLSLEKYVTLAEARPNPTPGPRPSFWQRLFLWRANWKNFVAEGKRTCSICGNQMDVWCDDVEWDEGHEAYQWVNRHCPKCKKQEMECLSP